MNVENVLRVANAIEKHEIKYLGFNMDSWYNHDWDGVDHSGHHCGTVACIGGWTGVVIKGGNVDTYVAGEVLELEREVYEQLFYPFSFKDEDGENDWTKITVARAVRTLRHLAATGKVDWNLPEPETEGAQS